MHATILFKGHLSFNYTTKGDMQYYQSLLPAHALIYDIQ